MVWEMKCWLFGIISYGWDLLIAKTPKQTSAVFPGFGCCMLRNLPIITHQMTSRKAQSLDPCLHAATSLLLIHSLYLTIMIFTLQEVLSLPLLGFQEKLAHKTYFWKLVWALLPNSSGKGAWTRYSTCYEATFTAPTSSPLTTGKTKGPTKAGQEQQHPSSAIQWDKTICYGYGHTRAK